jgi:hypothetical protein
VFTSADRDRLRGRVVGLGRADERIVSGAILGSLANGRADDWSDLDLTFAVRDGVSLAEVLGDWTTRLEAEESAAVLFDLPVGSTIYRVFLLPGSLQVDLSFTPERDFWPRGPSFQLLFGEAGPAVMTPPPTIDEIAGLAVHDIRATRVAIERGRLWMALYWLESLRNHALSIAAIRRGLKASYARSTDELPAEVLAAAEGTVVPRLDAEALRAGLRAGLELLFAEAAEQAPVIRKVEADLRELADLAELPGAPPAASDDQRDTPSGSTTTTAVSPGRRTA